MRFPKKHFIRGDVNSETIKTATSELVLTAPSIQTESKTAIMRLCYNISSLVSTNRTCSFNSAI